MRGSDFGAFVRRSEEVYGQVVVSSGSWLPSPSEGSGEAAFFDIAKLQKNVVHLGLFSNFFSIFFRVVS